MPAPRKTGLDYYPASVDMLQDPKFFPLRVKYGTVSIIIYQAILSMCFKDKGYYVDYADPDSILLTIAQYTAGRYAPTVETISAIISDLGACGLISDDLLTGARVITSRAIQRTYYSATAARSSPAVDFRIWLLTEEEMRGLNKCSPILKKWESWKKTGINPGKTGVNPADYPYSTEESTGTEESTRETEPGGGNDVEKLKTMFAEYWEAYPRKIGSSTAQAAFEALAPGDEQFADIMTGLAAWKDSDQWQTENGRYVPAPARFLTESYWARCPEPWTTRRRNRK